MTCKIALVSAYDNKVVMQTASESVGYARGMPMSSDDRSSFKLTGGTRDDQAEKSAFVAGHPKLVEWGKTSFYSVAPDKSAVVYGLNGNVYWQPASGKARLLGQAKNVKGWQWLKMP